MSKINLSDDEFKSIGVDLADLCVEAGLIESKTKARKAIQQAGVKVQDILVTDPFARVAVDYETNKLFLIQKESINVG